MAPSGHGAIIPTAKSVSVRPRLIADYLAIPLAKLPPEQLEWINTLVGTTLNKKELIEQVREHFVVAKKGNRHVE
jgi:hypothetical protein